MPKGHRLMLGLICLLLSAVRAGSSTTQAPGYNYIYYKDFVALLENMKTDEFYDKYFRVVNGFAHYNISPVPECDSKPCVNPIIEIADFQKGEEFVRSLPTVLLVAGFHGNEVVGTNSFYRLLQLFRKQFMNQNKWSNYLGNVRILITPMINVNGFNGQKREETVTMNGITEEVDPNRDFPYDDDPQLGCFDTSTAELLDAIFRDNLIVGCLTFHGGDNSITYPWGNYPHANSPETGDNIAFDKAAHILSNAAGGNQALGIEPYRVGTLHEVVYDVRGGFEDWGYGASFDKRYIDKTCARRSNPKFGLFPNNISYDDYTNRAFLFLVEAGFDKIPEVSTLGNGVALETDDYSQGKWGHIARNMNLSIRFLQLVGPFASIDKVAYSNNNLILDLSIYGCKTVNSVTADSFPLKELSKRYDQQKNQWVYSFTAPLNASDYKQISLKVVCDEDWGKPTNGLTPQSHLVRMRTNKDFAVEYNNYKLKSRKDLTVNLQNVRLADLDKSLIHYNGLSQYSLTYTSILEVASSSESTKKIKGHYKNGSMRFESEDGLTYTAKVHSFSSSILPNSPTAPRPRQLMEVKTGEPVSITSQNYLGMVGRSIELYDNAKDTVVLIGILNLEMPTAADEEKSSLPIPVNGVSCFSPSPGAAGRFDYVSIVLPADSDSLNLELYTSGNFASKFRLGQYTGAFESKIGSAYFKHTSVIPLLNFDNRVLGRTISIFDNNDNKIMSCVLGQRDPDTDVPRVLGYVIFELLDEKSMNLFKLMLILFFVSIIGGLAILLFRRYLGPKRDIEPGRTANELSMASLASNQRRDL